MTEIDSRLPDRTMLPAIRRSAKFAWCGALALVLCAPVQADWQRDDQSIAWRVDGRILWQFSFDPGKGKPFFHPLSAGGGVLTNFRPEDHPWHYGLWFSWKYINGANYWEEDRESGRAEGATQWSAPHIDTRDDGSATIRLELTYIHPSGRVDMRETRELQVSEAAEDGGYTIDWRSSFMAGEQGAILGRTPMPGEPGGKLNGGYAGLSARLADAPAVMSVLTPDGPVGRFESHRARPAAAAVAANFRSGGRAIGGIAIWSDPANAAGRAPWYVINDLQGMRFLCAAILAPKVRTLPAGGEWRLHYRVAVQSTPWTPESLGVLAEEWRGDGVQQSAVLDWNEIPARQADVRTLRQFMQGRTATLDELEIHASMLAPGASSHPPHRHPNEELVIVKEGTVEALVNGEWERVGPGSVIFNASNQLHAIRNVGDGPATYHVINWRVGSRLSIAGSTPKSSRRLSRQ